MTLPDGIRSGTSGFNLQSKDMRPVAEKVADRVTGVVSDHIPEPGDLSARVRVRLRKLGIITANFDPPAPWSTIGPVKLECTEEGCIEAAAEYYGKAGPLIDDLTDEQGEWSRLRCHQHRHDHE